MTVTLVPSGNSLTDSQNPGPMVVLRKAPLASMKLERPTSRDAFQYVESAVIPPILTSAGVPVRFLRFSSRFFVRTLGAVVFPTYSSKKAVSILKLPNAGWRVWDAVEGRDGDPVSFRFVNAKTLGRRKREIATLLKHLGKI